MGTKRHTQSKDLNVAIEPFLKNGWTLTRNGKGGQPVLIPPPAVLEANPNKPRFVACHGTPSDVRATRNTVARLRSYIDPRPTHQPKEHPVLVDELVVKKFFCVECGPTGPEFPSLDQRSLHMEEVHSVRPADDVQLFARKSHLWAPGHVPVAVKRSCIVCGDSMDARGLRKHIAGRHPEIFEALGMENLRGAALCTDELKAALEEWGRHQVEESPLAEVIPINRADVDTVNRLIDVFFDGAFKVRSSSDFLRLSEIAEAIDRLVEELS